MVINHSLAARQIGIVNNAQRKSMERLSSGYQINRAADDAAGLAISEKMRNQIRGLARGIANSQEGISLCQVADGALHEVKDILHRISELSVQAANGTNCSEDREATQMEVSELLEEIDRIGKTTHFNEIYFFTGTEMNKSQTGTGSSSGTAGKSFFDIMGSNVTQSHYMSEGLTSSSVTGFTYGLDAATAHPSVHIDFDGLTDLSTLIGSSFEIGCCTGDCSVTISFVDDKDITIDIDTSGDPVIGDVRIGLKKADDSYYKDGKEFCKYIFDKMNAVEQNPWYINVKFAYKDATLFLYDENNGPYDVNDPTDPWKQEKAFFRDAAGSLGSEDGIFGSGLGKNIYIQSGANAGDGIMMFIDSLSTEFLGLSRANVLTEKAAADTIKKTAKALKIVSKNSSRIGAQQNRLEHTIESKKNAEENLTASESRIRDVDIAEEMVRYSIQNILLQSGNMVLAQANSSMQNVLALLQ